MLTFLLSSAVDVHPWIYQASLSLPLHPVPQAHSSERCLEIDARFVPLLLSFRTDFGWSSEPSSTHFYPLQFIPWWSWWGFLPWITCIKLNCLMSDRLHDLIWGHDRQTVFSSFSSAPHPHLIHFPHVTLRYTVFCYSPHHNHLMQISSFPRTKTSFQTISLFFGRVHNNNHLVTLCRIMILLKDCNLRCSTITFIHLICKGNCQDSHEICSCSQHDSYLFGLLFLWCDLR